MKRRALLVCLPLLLSSPLSRAQESEADRLYREGQEAFAAKDYSTACAKFAASLQLEPGIGTRLWLADCYEKQGRLASAWRTFRDAAAAATEANDSRAQVAATRAAQLEPKLAKLLVRIVAPPKDFELRLDGVRVAPNVPHFVDRGRHEVRTSAGEERIVDVDQDGKLYELSLDPPKPSAPVVLDEQRSTAWPIAGWSLVAGGAIGLGVGSFLGLRAKSRYDEAAPHCPSACNEEGYALRTSAFRTATASTVFVVAGGVLAVAGVTVLVVAPSASSKSTSGSLTLQVGMGSLSIGGSFL